MDLLLDTHALVWWVEGSERLGARAHKAIGNPEVNVFISAASVWEIAIKSGLGRLKLRKDPGESVALLFAAGALPLPIGIEHALAVRALPLHHADPFDRILIAQAMSERLTLVTADSQISAYDVQTLDASL
jgi:PIN domain nuclease of toxin-antitoxin system